MSRLVTTGGGDHSVELLHSAARTNRSVPVGLPGSMPAVARSYDSRGRLVRAVTLTAEGPVLVVAGGFTLVTH